MKPDPQKTNSIQSHGSTLETAGETERINNTLRAYKEMRARILSGNMPAGTQYLEQELAEMLGMSRTPVREALIRLADDRLVEVRPRHGARVLGVSADELNDIYEICSDLEAVAARRLAQRGVTDTVLIKLESACAEMDRATEAKDFDAWVMGDQEFHEALVCSAGNNRLAEIFATLMAQAYRVRRTTMNGRQIPSQSNLEHRQIIDALMGRDAERAYKLMFSHRDRSRSVLVDLLRRSARSV